MNRVNLPSQSESPNFIGSWMIKSSSLCDELIAYFDLNKAKQKQGEAGTRLGGWAVRVSFFYSF